MYYTILVNTESWDYERDRDEIGEKETQFNAKLFWNLANRVLHSFTVNDRMIKNVYIGLSPDYEKIYRIKSLNFDEDSHPDTFFEDEFRIKDFLEIAGDSLKQWPDEIDHISVTFEFCDDYGMPTDADMLRFSEVADIDCEAVIFDEDTKQLVCQGYERGEYETGYYSNEQAEIYLADHKYQKTLKDLQDEKMLIKRMIV
jgi:hypothetical protein